MLFCCVTKVEPGSFPAAQWVKDWGCPCCGLGCCSDTDSIPGPELPHAMGAVKKKKYTF